MNMKLIFLNIDIDEEEMNIYINKKLGEFPIQKLASTRTKFKGSIMGFRCC